MKVRELIEKLKDEDPEATIAIVPSKYRNYSLSRLTYDRKNYSDEVIVAGKDSSDRGKPQVVLLAASHEERYQ